MEPSARRFHCEASGETGAAPELVFAFLDDHAQLSAHMASSSAMMAGGSMRSEVDERGGRGLGAPIRMTGRVLGIPLSVDEVVTQYEPPLRKAWRTVGEPKLLVIGGYAMGTELQRTARGCAMRVWIDYGLPQGALRAALGRLFGRMYASWCVTQMLRTCQQRFPERASAGLELP